VPPPPLQAQSPATLAATAGPIQGFEGRVDVTKSDIYPAPLRLKKHDGESAPLRLEYGINGLHVGSQIEFHGTYQGPFIMEFRRAASGDRQYIFGISDPPEATTRKVFQQVKPGDGCWGLELEIEVGSDEWPLAAGQQFSLLWKYEVNSKGLPQFTTTLKAGSYHRSFQSFDRTERMNRALVRHADRFIVRQKVKWRPFVPMTITSLQVKGMALLDAKQVPAVSTAQEPNARLFIGILTAPDNQAEREGQRNSWMRHPEVMAGRIKYKFFIGTAKDATQREAVRKESDLKGDIVTIEKEEGYYNIAHKTLEIVIYGSSRAEYIMKADDDTYIQVDNVLKMMGELPRSVLIGCLKCDPSPHRKGRWAIPHEEFAGDTFPLFPHGAGYVVSKDVGQRLEALRASDKLKVLRVEDVSMGLWVQQLKEDEGMPIKVMHDTRFRWEDLDCSDDSYTVHKATPRIQACMWQSQGGDVCSCR